MTSQVQRSVGSKDLVKINGRTDGFTFPANAVSNNNAFDLTTHTAYETIIAYTYAVHLDTASAYTEMSPVLARHPSGWTFVTYIGVS